MAKNIIKDIAGKGTEIRKEPSVGIERVEPNIIDHETRIDGLEGRENVLFNVEHDSTTGEHARATAFEDGILTKEDYLEFSKSAGAIAKRQAIQACPVYQDAYDDMMGQADFLDAQLQVNPVPIENFMTEQYTFKATDHGNTYVVGDLIDSTARVAPDSPHSTLIWGNGGDNKGDTGGFSPGAGTSGYMYTDDGCIIYLPTEALPSLPRNLTGDGDLSPQVTTSFTVQCWGYQAQTGGIDVLWQLGGFKYDGLSLGFSESDAGELSTTEDSIYLVAQNDGVRKRSRKSVVDVDALLPVGQTIRDRWAMYTVVYDVESEKIKLYVNETYIMQINMDDSFRFTMGHLNVHSDLGWDVIGTIDTPKRDSIVLTAEGPEIVRPWDGYIQMFRTFDQYVLSPEQIAETYQSDWAKLNVEFGSAGNLVIATKNITDTDPLIVSMAQGFEGALPKDLTKVFTNNFTITTVDSADLIAGGDTARWYVYLDYTTGDLEGGTEVLLFPVYEAYEPMWWTPRFLHPLFDTTKMRFYDSTDVGPREEITRIYLGEVIYYEGGGLPYVEVISYRPKGEGTIMFNWDVAVDGIDVVFNHNTGIPWEHLHNRLVFLARPHASTTANLANMMIDIYPDHNSQVVPRLVNVAHSVGGTNRLTEYEHHIEDGVRIVDFSIGGADAQSGYGEFILRFTRTW